MIAPASPESRRAGAPPSGRPRGAAASPFETLDQEGVGRLVELAVEAGRAVNSRLETGVCGEHGGDPESIHFFHRAGLDYVSCSPFRIPAARLEAGRAALSGAADSDSR